MISLYNKIYLKNNKNFVTTNKLFQLICVALPCVAFQVLDRFFLYFQSTAKFPQQSWLLFIFEEIYGWMF